MNPNSLRYPAPPTPSGPVNDGGPAFPVAAYDHPTDVRGNVHPSDGMTLRDYFAAAALQGLLACENTDGERDYFAALSYKYADAMIAARGGAS